jgi:NADP-dependent 3-hydroxy acid dehydrogenase YdfG
LNKIAFITGATSGIGRACADEFSAQGYDIIITGRRADRLTDAKRELENQHGNRVLTLCFDVRDRAEVFRQVEGLPPEWQAVKLLINNAGLALGKDLFDDADMDDWDTMMHTNVDGLLYVSRAVLPLLRKTGQAHIINIGSIAGKEVYEAGNVYCASKYAVDAITKAMRIDLLKHGIKVTGIHPGAVETEFSVVRFKGDEGKASAAYKGFVPLTAADIADTVYYTASLPTHVCINELVITCLQQAGTYYFYKQ